MSDLVDYVRTLIIQPGDKLVFHLGELDVTEAEIDDMKQTIAQALPEVPFIVVTGGISVDVVRQEDGK